MEHSQKSFNYVGSHRCHKRQTEIRSDIELFLCNRRENLGTPAGTFTVKYIFRTNTPLKHELVFVSSLPGTPILCGEER